MRNKVAIIMLAVVTMAFRAAPVKDEFTPLPAHSVHFDGVFEEYIQNSIVHWNKGVVPYAGFVEKFRSGRDFFAQGEMWGKAVRSGCMFYRYTQDPVLKSMLKETVYDLLGTKWSNGSISCSDPSAQPDGPGGDLWERKYVLLGLDEYYEQVDRDPKVLQAMIDEMESILSQVGPSPKISITDQGWSPNHIESSTLLEPVMRLYNLTHQERYLDFARYIVEVGGGAKGYRVFEDAFANIKPEKIGGDYPKAYEMMSLFEGLCEFYRVTGDERWKTAILNLFKNIIANEITLVGNGGGDQPYHPAVMGEAWDNTAFEQTNPNMKRMMETCVGVTWLKLCSQVLRLTADPEAVDMIEKYIYNGLFGAMKPTGDGFSYVNLLNGVKTNPEGWGGKVNGVYVTCCNLNGPMGLAYLPFVAAMNSRMGPVINLYNTARINAPAPGGQAVELNIQSEYPKSGSVVIVVKPALPAKFSIKLRIPSWSHSTSLTVNGKKLVAKAGTYADLYRKWSHCDTIRLQLDMRCRLIPAPHGSNRAGDAYQALVRGPVVLARDENIDTNYDKPVAFLSHDGYVEAIPEPPALKTSLMQFMVVTTEGLIHVTDYASVNNWNGTHICTWMPKKIP